MEVVSNKERRKELNDLWAGRYTEKRSRKPRAESTAHRNEKLMKNSKEAEIAKG